MTIHPRQVLSAFGWSFVQSWGSQLTKLGVFIVLARLLDPRDIGLVAFALVFIQAIQSFTITGVSDALVQKEDIKPETVNAVFWLNMFIAAVLAIALFLLAPFLEASFKMEGLSPILRWISPIVILQALAVVQAAQFQRSLRMRPLALRQLLGIVVGGVAGIAAALQGAGAYALVASALTGQCVGTLCLWASSDWRPKLTLSLAEIRGLGGFALHRTGSATLAFISSRLDDLLIGVFLGPVALGYYAVAYRLLQAANLAVTEVVARTAFPLFSRLQSDRGKLNEAFVRVSRVSASIAIGLFSGLFWFAPQIVTLLFGEHWSFSVSAMQILCVAGVAFNMVSLNRALMRAVGAVKWELASYVLQSMLCFIAYYFAAQVSIEVMAAAASLIMVILIPLLLVGNRLLVSIALKTYLTAISTPWLAAIASGVAVWSTERWIALSTGSWEYLVLQVGVFAAVYSTTIAVLLRHDIFKLINLALKIGVDKRRHTELHYLS